MSSRAAKCCLLALLLAFAPAAALANSPSPQQIHAALTRAKRSHDLWATINVCNTHRDTIGLRGQMPTLGFTTGLFITVTVDYWQNNRPKPVPGATKVVYVDTAAKGLFQGGANFHFGAHAGRLSGTITFVWRRNHKVLGRAIRPTTSGHRDVHFASPPHFSAARCTLP